MDYSGKIVLVTVLRVASALLLPKPIRGRAPSLLRQTATAKAPRRRRFVYKSRVAKLPPIPLIWLSQRKFK